MAYGSLRYAISPMPDAICRKMTYLEALRYLSSLVNYEQKSNYPYLDSFELKRVEDFLRLLGEPQKDLKCLHIAGSKGKGSTCVFAAYILKSRIRLVYIPSALVDFRKNPVLEPKPRTRKEKENLKE